MPKFAANLTFLFNEVDFVERFGAAAASGFGAVEYASPYEYEPGRLSGLLETNRLTQVLFNMPSGDWDAGERGIAVYPDRVGEFQDGVATVIEYAAALGCKQVNCLAGVPPTGVDAQGLRDTFVSNLRFAAGKLGQEGIRLLVEPINTRDIPGFYLTNTAQARSIIEEVGSDNLSLQYDVYHMQIMEGDLAPTLEANLDIIRHVQIADNPGRNEPGTGEINYPFLFGALNKMGYDGWVSCEYRPLTTTVAGLGWAGDFLRPRQ